MAKKSPKPETPQIALQLREIGRLVTYWNALEWQVRELLLELAPDILTAAMLTADFTITGVINSVRMMARERAGIHDRVNEAIATNKHAVPFDSILAHIEHYLEAVDRLREHRNFIVHNSQYDPANEERITFVRLSSRSRFAMHQGEIDDLAANTTAQWIEVYVIYGVALLKALKKNEKARRPAWPEKPPLPDKLKMPLPTILDSVPRPESFQK
jgi:hypothetical protein